ncbi:type II secretion system protein [Mastigocoleus sp. MO_188.B34]|uniref:pilus assembly FimT family protein n=1 Tax=Mastigocoleus sp. MO_188.B34 TaxID=3036635 RepID=UPI00260810EB|nr:type II secretion system protein [Mastigocoleus sp. MO_188.B34]MDJ0696178.1 type II secretion system protein [Mastigocoleus sp. MO_188.B34]
MNIPINSTINPTKRINYIINKNKLHFNNLNAKKNPSDTGFTILEILVAIVIIGILAAIVGPSWLGFVNRQQLNKANDEILSVLQEAQRKAKKTKLPYSVSFSTESAGENKEAKVAIHPSDSKPDQYWETLGSELGLKANKLILGTNIAGKNKSTKTISYASKYNEIKPQAITFNQIGGLPDAEINDGIKVVVAIPKSGKVTQASDVKRCVVVQTILGGMRTAKNNECE